MTRKSLRTIVAPSMAGIAMLCAVWLAEIGVAFFRVGDVVVPLLVLATVAAIAAGISYGVSHNVDRAGLHGLLAVLAFGTLGDLAEAVRYDAALTYMGGEWLVLGLYALVFAGPTLFIHRTARPLGPLRRSAVFAFSVLAAMNIGSAFLAAAEATPPAIEHGVTATKATGRPPDIYLIVVDKYAGSDVLRRQYGFNNDSMVTWLEQRRFVVPRAAHANYVQTFLALASMLNLRYLDDYPSRFGRTVADRGLALPEIENNRLMSFLRDRGYRLIFSPSAFSGTRRNRYADDQMPAPADVIPSFFAAWYRSTALPVLHRLGCRVTGCDVSHPPYPPASADAMMVQLDRLVDLAERPDPARPRLVFAHLLLPHEPYLFHSDCTRRSSFWPGTDLGDDAALVRAAYIDQVQCLNRQLQRIVSAIRSHAPIPPVIVIQGDHGHGRMGLLVRPLPSVHPDLVEERVSVFAAYHLPGVPADSVATDITPINMTRLILRRYFGAKLPRVEDATYWSPTHRPYDFVRLR